MLCEQVQHAKRKSQIVGVKGRFSSFFPSFLTSPSAHVERRRIEVEGSSTEAEGGHWRNVVTANCVQFAMANSPKPNPSHGPTTRGEMSKR